MRFSSALALVAGAATAAAQVALPSSIFGLPFGAQCQGAVLQTLTNGSFAQCFPTADLLPLLSTNGSIIPILDKFMTDLCYKSPCSNATLMAAAQAITTGCAADLQTAKLPNTTVAAAFGIYPVLREVLCLKTSSPYTAQSYGGILGPAPIPISAAYNQTNGTFCVSSVLTQYSAYLGANLTIPYIVGAATGANSTAAFLVKQTNPNALCNECIFGAVGVIEAAAPIVGRIPISSVLAYVNMTYPGDQSATLNTILNSTCAYKPLAVNTTVLPQNVTVSIVNSTFTPRLRPATSA